VLGKISWNDLVKKEVLRRVLEERNILYAIERREATWICHMLSRKCLLNHVIAGMMEGRLGVTRRHVRGCIQPLDNRTSREATGN
jgi:hypothetical protein